MLSGRDFDVLRTSERTEQLAIAGVLRAQGYQTLAFVAGGFMRSRFGYVRQAPGFALGFDLYFEGQQVTGKTKVALGKHAHSALESERALVPTTHTLAPVLERSLRWFEAHPGEAAFHFLHGYDVHEYRSVKRSFWERSKAAWMESGGQERRLEGCMREVGAEVGQEWMAHHHYTVGDAYRRKSRGRKRACHRLITQIVYGARALSAEAILDRYLRGLKEQGVYEDALLIVTSDHGENLLDQVDYWGHNWPFPNTLHIPLWIKTPRQAMSRTVDDVVGLVDLRATILNQVGMPGGGTEGVDVLTKPIAERALPFYSGRFAGYVLPDRTLCRWRDWSDLRVYDSSRNAWIASSHEDCESARRNRGSAPESVDMPSIPSELREELEILGYVEP
jgi:hypothetical protein